MMPNKQELKIYDDLKSKFAWGGAVYPEIKDNTITLYTTGFLEKRISAAENTAKLEKILPSGLPLSFNNSKEGYETIRDQFPKEKQQEIAIPKPQQSYKTNQKKTPIPTKYNLPYFPHDGNTQAVEAAQQILETSDSLILLGPSGSGKTHLIYSTIQEATRRKIPSGYLDIDFLAKRLSGDFAQNNFSESEKLVNSLMGNKLLAIESLHTLRKAERSGCQKRIPTLHNNILRNNGQIIYTFTGYEDLFDQTLKELENKELATRLSELDLVQLDYPNSQRKRLIEHLLESHGITNDLERIASEINAKICFPSVNAIIGRINRKKRELTPTQLSLYGKDYQEILGQIGNGTAKKVLELIANDQALKTKNLNLEEILGDSRKPGAKEFRYFTAYALHEIAQLPPKDIGKIVGGRTKSTIETYLQKAKAFPKENLDQAMSILQE